MKTMRAAVFLGKGKIELREVAASAGRARRGARQGLADDDLRNRRPHPEGRVSGQAGPDRRPRAGRRDRGARCRRARVQEGRSRHRRRHHPVRPVPRLPFRPTARSAGTAADGYEAIGGWRFGNTIDGCQAEYVLVPDAQANLAQHPGRPDGRGGSHVPGHHVDRLLGRRARPRSDRRRGRGVRAGADRALRDRRRAPLRCVARHRRRQRAEAQEMAEANGRRRRARLQASRTSSPRSSGSRAAASTSRSRRSACRRPSRTACAACARAARCRASASTRATSPCRSTPSPPASATTRSSPRSAPAARNACAAS